MPNDKLSVDDFALRIKTQYPAYKDIDNTKLVNSIIEKYPVYAESVDFSLKKKVGTFDSQEQQAEEPMASASEDGLSGLQGIEDISKLGLKKQVTPTRPTPIPTQEQKETLAAEQVASKQIMPKEKSLDFQSMTKNLEQSNIQKEQLAYEDPTIATNRAKQNAPIESDESLLNKTSSYIAGLTAEVAKSVLDFSNNAYKFAKINGVKGAASDHLDAMAQSYSGDIINSDLSQEEKNKAIEAIVSEKNALTRGIENISEYQRYALPDNLPTNVAKAIAGMGPDLIAAALMPEVVIPNRLIKAAPLIAKYLPKVAKVAEKYLPKVAALGERAVKAPFTTIMATKGVVESGGKGENPMLGGLQGAAEGLYMHGLGEAAGAVSPILAKALVKLGLDNTATAMSIATPFATAGTFATAKAIRTPIETGKMATKEELEMELGMGLGFSTMHLASQNKNHSELNHFYDNVLRNGTTKDIENSFTRVLSETQKNVDLSYNPELDLTQAYKDVAELKDKILKEPDLQKKRDLGDAAIVIQNQIDAKIIIDRAINYPAEFITAIDGIKNATPEQKAFFIKKSKAMIARYDTSEEAVMTRALNESIGEAQKQLDVASKDLSEAVLPSDKIAAKLKADEATAKLEEANTQLIDIVQNPKAETPKNEGSGVVGDVYLVDSMFIEKINPNGENTELTERQEGSIEKAVQMAIDAGQTAEQIAGSLNGLGYAFKNPLGMQAAQQTLINYIKNRINGTDTRNINEFAKDTKAVEIKKEATKEEKPVVEEKSSKAEAPITEELSDEAKKLSELLGEEIPEPVEKIPEPKQQRKRAKKSEPKVEEVAPVEPMGKAPEFKAPEIEAPKVEKPKEELNSQEETDLKNKAKDLQEQEYKRFDELQAEGLKGRELNNHPDILEIQKQRQGVEDKLKSTKPEEVIPETEKVEDKIDDIEESYLKEFNRIGAERKAINESKLKKEEKQAKLKELDAQLNEAVKVRKGLLDTQEKQLKVEQSFEVKKEAPESLSSKIEYHEGKIEDLTQEIENEKSNYKDEVKRITEELNKAKKDKLSKEKIDELKSELDDALDSKNNNIQSYNEEIASEKLDIKKAKKEIEKLARNVAKADLEARFRMVSENEKPTTKAEAKKIEEEIKKIQEEMDKMSKEEIEFEEPSDVSTTRNLDPINESKSSTKVEALKKLRKFLGKDNKIPLTQKIEVFNNIPMIHAMSDILAAGDIVNSMNQIMKVGGGKMFNVLGDNIDLAWAGVSEAGAALQLKNARDLYVAHKDLFERLWSEGKLPDGHIPMAVMRMGNTAINSNEAVFRYIDPYVSSLPEANRKAALDELIKGLKEKAEGNSGSIWYTELAEKIETQEITTLEGVQKYLEKIINDVSSSNAKKLSANGFLNKTKLKKEGKIKEIEDIKIDVDEKVEKIIPFMLIEDIQSKGITTIDGFLKEIIEQSKRRAAGEVNMYSLPIRSYIYEKIFSKETSAKNELKPIKALLKGVENAKPEMFTSKHIYEALGEPSMMAAKQGEVVSIVGIKVAEKGKDGNYVKAGGVKRTKGHDNYGYGPEGRVISLIENPKHGIDVFPEFKAKAVRIFKESKITEKPITEASIKTFAKKLIALNKKNPEAFQKLSKEFGETPEMMATEYLNSEREGVNPEFVKSIKDVLGIEEKSKYPSLQAVANQTGGAFFIDEAFKGSRPMYKEMKDLNILVAKLRYAFPDVQVTFTKEEFDKILDEPGVRIKESEGKILYGLTKDGRIFLNPEYESLNTPIHEFGHIWIDYLRSKVSGKKGDLLLARGLDLVKGTKEYNDAFKKYKNNDKASEEALVELIAKKGVTIIDAAKKSKFKSWMNATFKYIKDNLVRSKDISNEDIKNIDDINKFVDVGLADLFSGERMKGKFSATEVGGVARFSLDDKMTKIIELGKQNNFSDKSIKEVLKSRGYTDEQINEAFPKEFSKPLDILSNAAKADLSIRKDKLSDGIDKIIEKGKITIKNAESLKSKLEKLNVSNEAQVKKFLDYAEKMFVKQPTIEYIRDAYKATVNDIKNRRVAISDAIKGLVKDGSITTAQSSNLISKLEKLNVNSDLQVKRFLDYTKKVFDKADYVDKLSTANSAKKEIAKLSKDAKKNVDLTTLGKQFSEINPSMVEDIDRYNEIASKISETLKGSKISGEKINQAETVNIDEASNYIKEIMDAQRQKLYDDRLAEVQELIGLDASEFSFEELKNFFEDSEATDKYKETIVRDITKKMFDNYSAIIDETLKTGYDAFYTGEKTKFTDAEKELVRRFMDMDLSILKPKDALDAVDSIANFLENQSTAKMEATLSEYKGEFEARRLEKLKVRARDLKLYWSENLGELFADRFTSLPLVIEKMFGGVEAGGRVMDAMGLTDLINKKAEALKKSEIITDEYIDKFKDSTPNGKDFHEASNIIERGIAAHMMRSVIGTKAEMKAEFELRRSWIKQSIEKLKEGDNTEQEKAKLYEDAYNKIVKDSENIDDIKSKTDKENLKAVDFWIDKWAESYDKMSDVSKTVYNELLDKESNYSPDRMTLLKDITSDKSDLSSKKSQFNKNNGTLYKKESGSLMKALKKEELPKDRYIDLSFDTVNSNAMYDSLIDTNTAASIRRVESFLNSNSYKKIFPKSTDAALLKERVSLYVRATRKKNIYNNDILSKSMKRLNRIASLGVTQALGGPTQAVKQVIPVAFNTIINAGRLDLGVLVKQGQLGFIDRSGRGIAIRGKESQTGIESVNKLLDKASRVSANKVIDVVEQANKMWLDIFLRHPDAYIAKASWITYYEKSLKKQGVDISKLDYKTDKVNDEAADYAQRMVDRQQNVSDFDLSGKMFTANDGVTNWVKSTVMPFASFRMNQTMRMMTDISNLQNWKTMSIEDRKTAVKSLAGFGIEIAMFKLAAMGISILSGDIGNMIMGNNETKKERKKRVSLIIKGQATSAFTDIVSPLPVLDKPIAGLGNLLLDKVQTATGVKEDDKFSIYGATPTEISQGFGTLGIASAKVGKIYEAISLANTGKYTDDYGNERKLTKKGKTGAKYAASFHILGAMGILPPSDAGSIANNMIRVAKKKTRTPL